MPLNTQAVVERFEGVAANLLEDMLFEIEQHYHLKVTGLAVHLVPDGGVPGVPVVQVHLAVEAPAA